MKRFVKHLKSCITAGALLFVVNALFFVLLRMLETGMMLYNHKIPGILKDSVLGLGHDIVALGWITLILLPLLFLFHRIGRKACLVAGAVFSVIFQIIHFLIVNFYISTLTPLDALFLAHSKEELFFTLRTAGINYGLFVVGLTLFALLYVLSIVWFRKHQPFTFLKHYYLFFAIGVLAVGSLTQYNPAETRSFHSVNIRQNKSVHFYSDVWASMRNKWFSPFANWERDLVVKRYHSLFDHKEYVCLEYPFLNRRNRANPWGAFFNTSETPPSVVILIIEGLGNDFVKPGSDIVLMPFLDSLLGESLYYKHFLGAGERSYAVLPSITGSLPHAEKGFTLLPQMPLHLTLYNQLQHQGYSTGFFYGQGAYFHQKDAFLKRNHVDLIVDKTDFPAEFVKIYDPRSDYHWGYHDKDLFRNYFRFRQHDQQRPVFDVFFTGTMHSPFVIDQQEYYDQRLQSLLSAASLEPELMGFYENYAQFFRTVLFTDDALRFFFQEYQKLPAWQNTIFVITGDHPITEIPISNALKRYHVPLVVYSPLLNQAATFQAISGQFEVLPALVNLLEQNYGLQFGNYNHVFGVPADTCSSFTSSLKMPLMRGNRRIDEFVAGKLFYSGGRLYEILEDFQLKPNSSKSARDSLKEMLDVYNFVNNEVVQKMRLIPDSVFFQNTGFLPLASTVKSLDVSPSNEYAGILDFTISPGNFTDYFVCFTGRVAGTLPSANPKIVFELRNKEDQVVFWQSVDIEIMQRRNRSSAAFFNNYLSLEPFPPDMDQVRFLVYLWNPEAVALDVQTLELTVFAI
ncbi:MAG: LTA synthase family protein [Bacteroidales bacterium]